VLHVDIDNVLQLKSQFW